MSDQLLLTLQAALQQLAVQHTVETLGDRATYLGTSEIGACPRKTILSKLNPPQSDLVTLLRFRRGHMAEDIVAAAFTAAGFTNFQRQVEVRAPGDVPVAAHIDFVFTSPARKTMAVLEVKSPETLPDQPFGSWETQLYLQMGLLAAANRGILYVDEVNLLDDHLVDVLLDAAAMGVNVVEREGISFAHPARFILVGTMNPEEGELRPQLLDRFGLCVEVTGLNNLDARMAVVERRLAFERDPEAFAAGWQAEQETIRQSILNARERLDRVSFSTDLLRLITAICVDQGVDGHRADIFMLKVAQTLAAYRGREEVSPADVREAATLVLPHRLRRQPFSESEMDENRLEETFRKHTEALEPCRGEPPPPQPGDAAPDGKEAVLVGEVVTPPGSTFPVRPLELPPDRQVKKAPGARTRTRSEDHTGRYVRPTLVKPAIPDLAIDATIRAAAPYQGVRQRGNLALAIREPDLRYKVREKRIGRNILFVVDASGSMGADERMMETKAAILSLILLSLTLGAFLAQRKWLGKKNYATVTGKGDSGHHPLLQHLFFFIDADSQYFRRVIEQFCAGNQPGVRPAG